MSKHHDPHFNEAGGCQCKCRRCVRVFLYEESGALRIQQGCVCRRCNEQCPSAGRLFHGTIRERA